MNQSQPNLNEANIRPEGRIGQILLDTGKIKVEDAERILRVQKEKGLRFGDAAKQLGLITDKDIQQVLSKQFDYSYLAPGQGNYSSELVAAYDPFSPQVEALRAVRSQLMLRWFGPDRKSIAVVGANKSDGTSYTAANLAVVFSQLGERTLLVDGDLRQPRQQGLFKLNQRQGLSDVLAGKAGLEVIQKIAGFADLSVLGAGTIPPNPQELLGRPAFANLLQTLAANYDVILVDTAPISISTDAQTVAARTGGALMVSRMGQTRMAESAMLKDLISGAGAELVGAVVTQF